MPWKVKKQQEDEGKQQLLLLALDALESQKAVTAYLKYKQLLRFAFV